MRFVGKADNLETISLGAVVPFAGQHDYPRRHDQQNDMDADVFNGSDCHQPKNQNEADLFNDDFFRFPLAKLFNVLCFCVAIMQKLRECLGFSFHGPNIYGCAEWLPVSDGDHLNNLSVVSLAGKYGVRFVPSDFKNGDILRLKKDKDILIIRGAAGIVNQLLFQLDDCCRARDELLVAADGDKMPVHNSALVEAD